MSKDSGNRELTDIGGKCSNCGCEDKWLTIHEDRQPTRTASRSGQWLEWHESYEVECMNDLEDEDDFMRVYKCRTTKTIERDNELEYEDPNK